MKDFCFQVIFNEYAPSNLALIKLGQGVHFHHYTDAALML